MRTPGNGTRTPPPLTIYRIGRGLKQVELSKLAAVSVTAIRDIEQGPTPVCERWT